MRSDIGITLKEYNTLKEDVDKLKFRISEIIKIRKDELSKVTIDNDKAVLMMDIKNHAQWIKNL
jgi:hypothetical protein